MQLSPDAEDVLFFFVKTIERDLWPVVFYGLSLIRSFHAVALVIVFKEQETFVAPRSLYRIVF